MFTGIVEEVGEIAAADRRADVLTLRVRARTVAAGLARGASIAVNGCCLTAVETSPDGFTCDLTRETLERTGFAERLIPGALVNLERPMRADGRFDGHIVQGHVDGIGTVRSVEPEGDGLRLTIEAGDDTLRYCVEKGSITVEGVSLTIAALHDDVFEVALIPHTLAETTLSLLEPGQRVNLEVDVLAKYVERLLAPRVRPSEA